MYSDTPMPSNLVVIAGAKKSGKSELAWRLGKYMGCAFGETVDVLIHHLARIQAATYVSGSVQEFEGYIRSEKARYRAALRELGDVLRMADPGFIVRAAVAKAPRLIVGPRRREEITWITPAPRVVYIKRAGPAVPASEREPDDHFDESFFRNVAEWDVVNRGSLTDLEGIAKSIAEKLR